MMLTYKRKTALTMKRTKSLFKTLNVTHSRQAAKISHNAKFAAFLCVFLTILIAGVNKQLGMKKILKDNFTCSDRKYNFLILGQFNCLF